MKSAVDPQRIVPDPQRTLREGAVAAFGRRGSIATAHEVDQVVNRLAVDPDVPWAKLPQSQRDAILFGAKPRGRTAGYTGIVQRLEAMLEDGAISEDEEVELDDGAISTEDLSRFLVTQVCEACNGTRLRPEALSVKVQDRSFADLCRLPLRQLRDLLSGIESTLTGRQRPVAEPLVRAVDERLGFLIGVGLDYLSLERSAGTLSGGEGQRIRLATQIGASLVGVLYVLDEPSVGLHPRDNQRLLEALRQLVTKGNSVLVVEHDRDAILAADYLVDMGPGAGRHGGTIVAQGTPEEVARNPKSVTGPYLTGERSLPVPTRRVKPTRKRIRVLGATAHNLKNVQLDLPLGLITAVTGVSGSGKSSLVVDTLLSAARAELYGATNWVGPCERIEGLDQVDKVISIDQNPIGRTPRSNAATYTGIFTHLRELYASLPDARSRGYKPGRFSFNVKGGRCESCQGDGVLRVAMHFLPDVYVTCDACNGERYNRETLEIKYRGHSIADALNLTVDEACTSFEAIPRIRHRLEALRDVGLGYLQLGQRATTLSGGEAQRVKLAAELARKSTGQTLYVMDEPTTGLHFQDIELLTHAIFGLRDAGNTVVIVEHNMDLVACCDWVVDLGPEGGVRGGEIVFAGTPEELAEHPGSSTATFLREALTAARGNTEPSPPPSRRGRTSGAPPAPPAGNGDTAPRPSTPRPSTPRASDPSASSSPRSGRARPSTPPRASTPPRSNGKPRSTR